MIESDRAYFVKKVKEATGPSGCTMTSRSTQLVNSLQSAYDGSLRAVATYDRDGYELHYTSLDIDANYSEGDIDDIYDDVVIQDIGQPFHEELFSDMGDVRGKLRVFEDGVVAHFWPSEDAEGVFLAFDSSADPSVRSLLELISEFYN